VQFCRSGRWRGFGWKPGSGTASSFKRVSSHEQHGRTHWLPALLLPSTYLFFFMMRFVLGLAVALLPLTALAQTADGTRDLSDIGMDIYRRANSPDALLKYNKDLAMAPHAYVVPMPQPGVLVLPNGRRVRVPSLRYNVAVGIVEATDSTGAHVWPPGSLREFYIGRGADARHFQTAMVRNGSTKQDFVEVLTGANKSLVILALQHAFLHEDAVFDPVLRVEKRKERNEIGQTVLYGSATMPKEPLRPLVMNRKNVLKLFGDKAAQVDAYATKEKLDLTDLGPVLRAVEYYNLVASKTE
jgi:hypothetical protein